MEKIINALREKIEKKKLNRQISRIPQKLKKYLRFKAKGKDRQINITKPTNLTRALMITAKIRGTRAKILINSKCLGNFVSSNFVKKA
jgi:mitochondrial fission protein ELM1